ncbi:MAG TPA: hypothetical protein IAC82_05935 [Candidatus Merdivicinus intestinigallinarum]|nr:hypothetical protein [Candidatus Merdivicinus intestinigallinarum]
MTKRYAFVEYGGQVMSIEARCSGFKKAEVQPGELAIEDIIHPDLVNRYVEITEGTGDAKPGMIYSDGKFMENPVAPDSRITELETQVAAVNDAVLGLMSMVSMQ